MVPATIKAVTRHTYTLTRKPHEVPQHAAFGTHTDDEKQTELLLLLLLLLLHDRTLSLPSFETTQQTRWQPHTRDSTPDDTRCSTSPTRTRSSERHQETQRERTGVEVVEWAATTSANEIEIEGSRDRDRSLLLGCFVLVSAGSLARDAVPRSTLDMAVSRSISPCDCHDDDARGSILLCVE